MAEVVWLPLYELYTSESPTQCPAAPPDPGHEDPSSHQAPLPSPRVSPPRCHGARLIQADRSRQAQLEVV